MATTERTTGATAYRIVTAMDGDGRMCVQPPGRRAEVEIVGYGDPLVRERLATREAGAAVRLDLAPAADRDDAYVATRIAPGSSGIVG